MGGKSEKMVLKVLLQLKGFMSRKLPCRCRCYSCWVWRKFRSHKHRCGRDNFLKRDQTPSSDLVENQPQTRNSINKYPVNSSASKVIHIFNISNKPTLILKKEYVSFPGCAPDLKQYVIFVSLFKLSCCHCWGFVSCITEIIRERLFEKQ